VFVANYLDNSVQIVDLEERRVTQTIALGGPGEPSLARRGEAIFYDGRRSLDQWYSCHSCHYEGGTNAVAMDTNLPPLDVSNPPVVIPPMVTNPPVVAPVDLAPVSGAEYVVVKGDSLAKIAKKNGVTLKALQAANPGVAPTKLKIGQKLSIPAGGSASTTSAAPSAAVGGDTTGATYTVKSGDTLTKIAKKNGTTVKAIEAANGLSTTKIKVGQKLKIPSKGEAAAPVAPAPVMDTTPAPALPPVAPAPPSAPAQQ